MAHTLFGRRPRAAAAGPSRGRLQRRRGGRLKRRRNWYRRIALGRARGAGGAVARARGDRARAPGSSRAARVRRIPNGIDTAAYARKPRRDALPRVIKRTGELWLGTLAGLRAVKNLPALVRALRRAARAMAAGDRRRGAGARGDPRRGACGSGIEHRVHLPGFVADPATAIGLFDLFALSSRQRAVPDLGGRGDGGGAAVPPRASATSRDGGRARTAPFAHRARRRGGAGRGARALAGDARAARAVGEANRARARAEFDEKAMIERLPRALCAGARTARACPDRGRRSLPRSRPVASDRPIIGD